MRTLQGASSLITFLSLFQLGLTDDPSKYLIISAPKFSKVVYTRLPDDSNPEPAKAPKPLIDSGLKMPQGLAVDRKRSKLYVADPDQRQVFCYTLSFSGGNLYASDEPTIAANDVEVRWVAIDGSGNVFITEEGQGQVMRINAEKLLRGDAKPEVIYDSLTSTHVSAPGGIAVDNFHVYWTNKAAGTEENVGSLVRGLEKPQGTNAANRVVQLAQNTFKAYGVCLTEQNVFYTNSDKTVFGVKKTGSAVATISDAFQEPRGCVWDGDGTVYIADKKAGTVSSFSGNQRNLAPTTVDFVVKLEDAFGLATVSSATGFLTLPFTQIFCVLTVLAQTL
jgi:hypothetical protein